MKKRVIFTLVAAIVLLSIVLSGCSSGSGIAQDIYDGLQARFQEAQAKVAELQDRANQVQADAAAKERELQAKVDELQNQVGGLQEQASLVGKSTADTAVKIVKNYKDTHTYSTFDLFICSDMASEVWNILKTQGITAVMVVGDIHSSITDIVQSNHAWVLASVGGGNTLALETTGGVAVTKAENALYYKGWTFDSPAALKRHNEIIKEYNVRVEFRNSIAADDRAVIAEHSQATNQAEADKLEAVHNKLVKMMKEQEAELLKLKAELDTLAKPL